MRMVEKGVAQSQQIKENPLTQNLMIGKRGRPPGRQMGGIKKQKSGSSESQNGEESQRKGQKANLEIELKDSVQEIEKRLNTADMIQQFDTTAATKEENIIQEAIEDLQKNQGNVSAAEFQTQKHFLSLLSDIQKGFNDNQMANSNQQGKVDDTTDLLLLIQLLSNQNTADQVMPMLVQQVQTSIRDNQQLMNEPISQNQK